MKCHALLLGLLWMSAASATEWAQFRGPHASGVDSSAPAPVRWDVEQGQGVLWRAPIPGLAHASPIIWRERIYVATAIRPGQADLKVGLYGNIEPANDQEQHQWRLLALDRKTGQVIWDKLAHEAVPRLQRHPKASHCNSTPATDGQHLVAIFGSEGLFCFDLEGQLRWRKDLGPMDSAYFEVTTAQWGFASSPVLREGKVVVLCDVLTDPYLAVFNLADGKELWRTRRRDVPTWGTPALAEVKGTAQILVNGWRQTAAYDFVSGKEVWSLNGGGDIPVPTPVVGDGLAYFTSAHGRFRPMRAVRLDAQGDITPPDPGATNAAIVWAHARRGNYMQTPLLAGGLLFGCLDNGILTCFDAKTGEVKYSERLGSGGEGFTSSPVSDGERIYWASELGNVYVAPVSPTFSIQATNRLDETCMATPALASGTLFYRTRHHLVAIGERPGR